MLRWIVLLLITLVVFDSLKPWLARFGLGRLPGDLNFRFLGRDWSLPIGSAVLLTLIGEVIAHLLS
jgi:hypothetical protein